jgi:hypothetical protein
MPCLGLIANYPRNRYSLTYSLAEPSIYYHQLESDFGLRGNKLKDRILNELKSVRAFQPASDAVDAIKTDEGNLLCIVREDGMSLINSLDDIKAYIGNRLPMISAIDSADVSFMNLVRANYEFEPQEFSVLVYVGAEFTRLIFMRGSEFHQFAPIIGEGYDSRICRTPCTAGSSWRDNLAILHLRRIILAENRNASGSRRPGAAVRIRKWTTDDAAAGSQPAGTEQQDTLLACRADRRQWVLDPSIPRSTT